MTGNTRNFVVGVTALLGLVGLAFMLLMFGEFAKVTTKSYELTLKMPNAAGLSDGSPIVLNGVRVGNVHKARTSEDPRDGVELVLKINQPNRVPKQVQVGVNRDFVGDTTLSLTAARKEGEADAGFFSAGDEFSATAGDFMDQITGMLDKRLGGLDDAVASFRRLSDTYVRVGEQVEEYLKPVTPQEVDAGTAKANLASTLQRIDTAVAAAETWLNDEQMREDIRTAAQKASAAMERIDGAVSSVQEAAGSISRNADRVGEGVDEAVKQLNTAMKTLNDTLADVLQITGQINRGKGTIANLLNNPDLYNSLNDAAIRLEKALTEAQLLLEKYRKEGIPIQF